MSPSIINVKPILLRRLGLNISIEKNYLLLETGQLTLISALGLHLQINNIGLMVIPGYIHVNPLTMYIDRIPSERINQYKERVLLKINNAIQDIQARNPIELLANLNDEFVDILLSDTDYDWKKFPSDTRFPGFFSDLADHTLATSAAGIALAMELHAAGVDFLDDYKDSAFKDLLDRDGILQVIRFGCLFHDIGKPVIDKHDELTKDFVKRLLETIVFKNITIPDK
nr:hypothetical protein [Candidatus Sigynarchaeota archaeon]